MKYLVYVCFLFSLIACGNSLEESSSSGDKRSPKELLKDDGSLQDCFESIHAKK